MKIVAAQVKDTPELKAFVNDIEKIADKFVGLIRPMEQKLLKNNSHVQSSSVAQKLLICHCMSE